MMTGSPTQNVQRASTWSHNPPPRKSTSRSKRYSKRISSISAPVPSVGKSTTYPTTVTKKPTFRPRSLSIRSIRNAISNNINRLSYFEGDFPQTYATISQASSSAAASTPSSTTVNDDDDDEEDDHVNTLYYNTPHTFSARRKRFIVYIVSFSSTFSPLSSDIYLPALNTISAKLHTDITMIRLSITTYLVCQAFTPMIWGPLADKIGRRVVMVVTLLVFVLANCVLSRVRWFWELLVFRALQSAGSAATISIGAGVIADLTTPAERGGYMGLFSGIRMISQGFGPVLGGVLSQFLGFRSIFVFLIILASTAILIILFFLPETLHSVAGLGDIKMDYLYRPFIYHLVPRTRPHTDPDKTLKYVSVSFVRTLWSAVKYLKEKDVIVLVLFSSISQTVYMMLGSSHSRSLQKVYGMNDLQIGLSFIPNGIGCMCGSLLNGWLLDRDWNTVQKKWNKERNLPEDQPISHKDYQRFPMEKARLRRIPMFSIVFVVSVCCYGWFLYAKVQYASVFVAHFFVGLSTTAIFSSTCTLTVDLFPGRAASAAALNNLMRCMLGAGGVAAIGAFIEKVDRGVTFTLLAIIYLASCLILVLEWIYGVRWRMERKERWKKRKEEKRAGDTGVIA